AGGYSERLPLPRHGGLLLCDGGDNQGGGRWNRPILIHFRKSGGINMLTRHFDHWPNRVPKSLAIPETNPYHNLQVSAARYPNKVAIHNYGGEVTYRRLLEEVDALAGFLQQDVGDSSGDRVMLFMQNSPQFCIAYYAILRANALIVPLNPKFLTR